MTSSERRCPTCGAPLSSWTPVWHGISAFSVGVIMAAVPLLFLMTRAGDAHPVLATRLGLCLLAGVVGVLVDRRLEQHRPRACGHNPR